MHIKNIFKSASARDKADARRAALNKLNSYGTTPFFDAIEKGEVSEVKKMLKDGAEVDTRTAQQGFISGLLVKVPYRAGATPLHAACLLGAADIVAVLLKKGADANAKDVDGHTPMDYAVLSFGYYKDELARRENSFFTTQGKKQRMADKMHDYADIVAHLRAQGGTAGMFEVPDALKQDALDAPAPAQAPFSHKKSLPRLP